YPHQRLAFGFDRLIPRLPVVDVKQEARVPAHEATPIRFREDPPYARRQNLVGRLLPRRLRARIILIVAFNDPWIGFPDGANDLVDRTVRQTTAPIQAKEHFVA